MPEGIFLQCITLVDSRGQYVIQNYYFGRGADGDSDSGSVVKSGYLLQ